MSEILERICRVEQKVTEQNKWIKRLDERVVSLDKRHWRVLVITLMVIVGLGVSRIFF